AAGHVALRWLGPQRGLALTGFFSGFVSSTVTIATFGRRAQAEPRQSALFAAGGVLSTAATWVQVLVMSGALSPAAAGILAPAALAGIGGALGNGALWWLVARRGGKSLGDGGASESRALRPREALVIAALLSGVTLMVSWARSSFGATGVLAGS